MSKQKTVYKYIWIKEVAPDIVNFGSTVSIILLFVHLVLFTRVQENRNLHHKNVASLCVALIFSYVVTIVDTTRMERQFCYVYMLAAFYFNMASAFWMLTIAHTIWKKVRSMVATQIAFKRRRRLRLSLPLVRTREFLCSTFLLHSLCNWTTPAVVEAILFFALPYLSDDVDIDNDFAYEKFNRTSCRFPENDETVKFVVTFYGTILAVNVYFFASTVRYIVHTKMAVRDTKCHNYNNSDDDDGNGGGGGGGGDNDNDEFVEQFRLYRKISLVMGLSWMVEMIMSLVIREIDELHLAFNILNSLEGCFIAVAFTSRKEVVTYVNRVFYPKLQDDGCGRKSHILLTPR